MTREAFSGLKADFDDKGNPVIKAVRSSDGESLAIEEMSDGSRDQLFFVPEVGRLVATLGSKWRNALHRG